MKDARRKCNRRGGRSRKAEARSHVPAGRTLAVLGCMLVALLTACSRDDAVPPRSTPAEEIPSPPPHTGRGTVAQRVQYYGPAARSRMRADWERAGVAYPPARVVLLAIKDQRRLEVYAAGATGTCKFTRAYPILGASGVLGPKLREGDGQVPEGIYPIELLNPNSAYHLSLRIGYPNAFDRRMARAEGRSNLGGDIMIHGGRASIGCLAMGDPVAEELFVLAADVGIERVKVIMTPTDFRKAQTAALPRKPEWVQELYAEIRQEMGALQPGEIRRTGSR